MPCPRWRADVELDDDQIAAMVGDFPEIALLGVWKIRMLARVGISRCEMRDLVRTVRRNLAAETGKPRVLLTSAPAPPASLWAVHDPFRPGQPSATAQDALHRRRPRAAPEAAAAPDDSDMPVRRPRTLRIRLMPPPALHPAVTLRPG